jgi:hypothetical protein
MTTQISDTFRHRKMAYVIAAQSANEKLFNPTTLGLKPQTASTSCWCGYYLVYSVHQNHLVVANLYVNLFETGGRYVRVQGPKINNVTPTISKSKNSDFNNRYNRLNYRLEYTGGLLLACDFIKELRDEVGSLSPWRFKTVIELVFTKGELIKEIDRSEKIAELREMILKEHHSNDSDYLPTSPEVSSFIDKTFDLKYRIAT